MTEHARGRGHPLELVPRSPAGGTSVAESAADPSHPLIPMGRLPPCCHSALHQCSAARLFRLPGSETVQRVSRPWRQSVTPPCNEDIGQTPTLSKIHYRALFAFCVSLSISVLISCSPRSLNPAIRIPIGFTHTQGTRTYILVLSLPPSCRKQLLTKLRCCPLGFHC